MSAKKKQMGILELTVPIEHWIVLAGKLTKEKYPRIVNDGKQDGWRVNHLNILWYLGRKKKGCNRIAQ